VAGTRGCGAEERIRREGVGRGGSHHDRVGADGVLADCDLEQPDVDDVDSRVVLGGHRRVGRQLAVLALDVDQARRIARAGLGQAVTEHDGHPAVVVAEGQLGVVEVDFPDVDEARQVLQSREDLGHDALGDLQARRLRDIDVAGVGQRRPRGRGVRHRDVGHRPCGLV
jgi:hypothetical protein